MTCPRCQSFVKDGLQFCTNCGERLAGAREATPAAEDTSERRAVSRDGRGEDATIVEPDALLGRVLDAKYELTGRLGEGGMGAVYRARRVHIGDDVAVKVLHPKYLEDTAAVERFRREARAAAQLHHTNVVTIHDYGETVSGGEKFAYIVMELVAGRSLRSILKGEKRLDAARAVQLMRDVCAGVGAAHRRQIVHRDIKPDNIIVLAPDEDNERETVKVVDFGIAKLRDLAVDSATLTQTGMVVGTPYYMSPEQCRGDSLDARSDVYSLGALLYEMLSGAPPFTAPTVTGVIAKHLTEPPPRLPSTVEPRPALEGAVMRALTKDPQARQRDAAEFARELSAAMEAPAAPRDSGREYGAHVSSNPAPPHVSAPPPHTATPQPMWPAPRPVTPTPAHEYAGRQQHGGAQHQSAPPAYFPQQQHGAGATPHVVAHTGAPPARRKSRAPLVAFVVLLLFAAGGAAILAVILANNQKSTRRETNSPAARSTSTNTDAATNNANAANANQRLTDRIAAAESKIITGAPLSESDLKDMTPQELRLLRNTVYARHGRQFTSGDLQQHFAARSWYKPRPGYSDDMLGEADQRNLAAIQEREGGGGETASADPAAVRKEVSDVLESWADSTGDRDIDDHMSHYAPTLDTYYNARAISAGQVRADRAKAFDRYAEMKVELRNIAVTPDASGAGRATAVFDKHWRFEGTQCSEGTVKQMLWLARAPNGRWLITGERDLFVYPDRNDDCH